jgi:hypothetical protein
LPVYCLGQPDNYRVNLLWTDHRGLVKRDLVLIEHLDPAAPTAQGREGIVLTGANIGRLVKIRKYWRRAKRLQVVFDADTAEGRPDESRRAMYAGLNKFWIRSSSVARS